MATDTVAPWIEHPNSEKDRNRADFLTPVDTALQNFLKKANTVGVSTLLGIDISKWQGAGGDFDALVAGGWEYVIIKATDGVTEDPMFQTYLTKAINAGMFIMVYCFFRSNLDGASQANKLLEVIQPLMQYQNKTVVWCDVETTDGVSNTVRIPRVKAFLDTIASAGHEAGIYTSPALWQSLMSPFPAWINQFWQWVAHWTPSSLPTLPTTWTFTKTVLWQIGIWNNYSWCPAVPGWSPDLDVDRVFFSSREEMESAFGIVYVNDPLEPVQFVVAVPVEYYESPDFSSTLLGTLSPGTVVDLYDIQFIGDYVWLEHELGWSTLQKTVNNFSNLT